MRKWSVSELESIESDINIISEMVHEDHALGIGGSSFLDDPMDCHWLYERISTRNMHGTYEVGQCDSCGITGNRLYVSVDEYPDELGAPSSLGITYLCTFCR